MPDDDFVVLHALRLKGIAAPELVEQAWGVEGAADALERLAGDGLCQYREMPRGGGWMLLPAGRERHAELLGERRGRVGEEALAKLAGIYDRFSALNDEFKKLCEQWQLRGGVMNDHTDHEYDEARITDLEAIHGRFLPLVMRAGKAVEHFGLYAERFRGALKKLTDDGNLDYFTKPLIDSYHTVWFEFHEDLIATLGRERQAHEA